MKLGFNLLSLPGEKLYGVGEFLRQMCVDVAQVVDRQGAELTVFHHEGADPGRLFGLERSDRIRWFTVRGMATRGRRISWEQVVLPGHLRGFDLLYSPNNVNPLWLPSETASIITIHDLLSFDDDVRFGLFQRLYLRCGTRAAAHRARRIITVSETTAVDIQSRLGVPSEKISIVRNVVQAPSGLVSNANEFERSFLVIGSVHRDKRIDLAIRGFHRFSLQHPGYRLFVMGEDHGALAELTALTRELNMADRVVFTGYVSSSVKWSALSACVATVLFGRREGFGIPVLEAMSVGKPSIVAPEGALPEVVGDAGVVVPPEDCGAVAGAMAELAFGSAVSPSIIARRLKTFDGPTQRRLFWNSIFAKA